MDLEKKIAELRSKQNVISDKKNKKKQELDKLTKQFTDIEKQI